MVSGLSGWIGPAREHADLERARAERAAAIARRHEQLALTGPDGLRAVHERLGIVHRRSEERHRISARLHDTHIRRLTRWFSAADLSGDRPRLISAVAELLGARSAGITLLSSRQLEASVIASDPLAAAAQDLEVTLGEGPIHESAATRRPVVATEDSLRRRWPHYSPAVRALGVRSLAVVPLGSAERCVGALAVFDPPRPEPPQPRTADLEELADALTHTMLLTEVCLAQFHDEGDEGIVAAPGDLLESSQQWLVVHQAAGMVAAQCDCSVEDAFTLVRARAFAEDVHMTEVARRIVDKRLRLDIA
ncbi:GAF and ANTAR domain-containing protein [Kribbella sp. WER1]